MTMIAALNEIAIEQARLDSIDDQLSVAIRSIETALRDRVKTHIEIEVQDAKFNRIAFGKINGAWCLIVTMSGTQHALTHVSREARAQALEGGHVRRLIDETAQMIRDQIAKREGATKAASELLAMLGAQQDKDI